MPRALNPAFPAVSVSTEALGADEFAALMDSFAFSDGPVAIAVSGGPDSMSLAICMQRWGAEKKIAIQAFVVDHKLRPESSAEAQTTSQRLKILGIGTEILPWQHTPVVTRLHLSARKARYRLLIEACARYGIRDLFLAHQLEDQAETILMRLAKGSGIDGLAGMRCENVIDNVRLVRPLLNVPKERLIATCREASIDFIDDASNRAQKFARGRLRKVMPWLSEEGLTVERLVDLGLRAAEAKEALDYYTQIFLRNATQRDDAGVIRMSLEQLRVLPRAIAGRALSEALQNIHTEEYAPEHAPLMRVVEALYAPEDMAPRTLHGCLISKLGTQVTLMREIAGITDEPIIKPGESIIWDGRWKVSLGVTGDGIYTIRSLGHPEHEVLDRHAPGLRKLVPQGRARASLPCLWQDGRLVVIPSLNDDPTPSQARLVSAWPKG